EVLDTPRAAEPKQSPAAERRRGLGKEAVEEEAPEVLAPSVGGGGSFLRALLGAIRSIPAPHRVSGGSRKPNSFMGPGAPRRGEHSSNLNEGKGREAGAGSGWLSGDPPREHRARANSSSRGRVHPRKSDKWSLGADSRMSATAAGAGASNGGSFTSAVSSTPSPADSRAEVEGGGRRLALGCSNSMPSPDAGGGPAGLTEDTEVGSMPRAASSFGGSHRVVGGGAAGGPLTPKSSTALRARRGGGLRSGSS
ncbi:unnamed protein product, partial [Discosporangium mesarthrocarpum]